MTQIDDAMLRAVQDHPPIRHKREECDTLEGELNRARARWEAAVEQLEVMMWAEVKRRLKEADQ